ncbi:uncharacterized protein [Porites lutea]|uniref:uncharacterized protein n=1 Tax=Porites lutea TaxID=51062 RepID=UPI003CC5BF9E
MLLIRTDTQRSTTVSSTDDHVLNGSAIYKQRTSDFLSCAQSCLAHPNCMSFNYENIENGVCELNRDATDGSILVALTTRIGYTFGQFLNITEPVFSAEGGQKDHKYVFTTLGAREETGPSDISGYAGTSLEGKVTLNNGIQIWTVPVTGTYVIEATGGSGGNGTYGTQSYPLPWTLGGLGAKIIGSFKLSRGTQIKILVGQEGGTSISFPDRPGGGGGGTFVTLSDDTPLIIAGGGGGGGAARNQFTDGDPGQATTIGTQSGGTGGSGGQVCDADTGNSDSSVRAGAGAGLRGDGESSIAIATEALSFTNGGTGGTCPVSNGGFGGGGFAMLNGGGGGGYSGGGVVGTQTKGTAGGGGSYNVGTDQQNMAGVNKGDGKVIITLRR